MEQKSQDWISDNEARIREAFDLFDKDKTEAIVQEEVGTVLRFLGIYPTERALVLEILPEMQDDEPTGFVSYKKFEKKVLALLASREWEPDSNELILQAFKTLDTANNGYLSADILEELLTSKGTAFRPKELEAFFNAAKDPESSNIYYEDYISILSAQRQKK